MTRYQYITKILGTTLLILIGRECYAQPSKAPVVDREAQEIIVSATETIKTDKMTIESRSERIRMLREQLEMTQGALELCKENGTLSEELKGSYESQIAFLEDQTKTLKKEIRKLKVQKVGLAVLAGVEAGVIVYLLVGA